MNPWMDCGIFMPEALLTPELSSSWPPAPDPSKTFNQSQPSVMPSNPETLQLRLQTLIEGARESWTYAIFWQSSVDRSLLGWGDGYYKGEVNKGKRTMTSALEQEHRKKVLKDLFSLVSLVSGPSTTVDDDDVDEEVTDTEWFFLVSMTKSFVNCSGLPGRAFFNSSPVWVAGAELLAGTACERTSQGQVFGLQTIVFIPLANGVVELGSTEVNYQSSDFMNKVRVLFNFNSLELGSWPKTVGEADRVENDLSSLCISDQSSTGVKLKDAVNAIQQNLGHTNGNHQVLKEIERILFDNFSPISLTENPSAIWPRSTQIGDDDYILKETSEEFQMLNNLSRTVADAELVGAEGSKVGLQREAVPNFPPMAMPRRSSQTALSDSDLNSVDRMQLNVSKPRGDEMEAGGPHEQGMVSRDNYLQDELQSCHGLEFQHRNDDLSKVNVPIDDGVKEVIPKVGMVFESEEAACNFYKTYASNVGFKVRKGHSHNRNGKIMDRIFCCSREGKRGIDKRDVNVKKHRVETRCGCEARMKIKCSNRDKYSVIEFNARHNHVTSSPSNMSQRNMTTAQGAEANMADYVLEEHACLREKVIDEPTFGISSVNKSVSELNGSIHIGGNGSKKSSRPKRILETTIVNKNPQNKELPPPSVDSMCVPIKQSVLPPTPHFMQQLNTSTCNRSVDVPAEPFTLPSPLQFSQPSQSLQSIQDHLQTTGNKKRRTSSASHRAQIQDLIVSVEGIKSQLDSLREDVEKRGRFPPSPAAFVEISSDSNPQVDLTTPPKGSKICKGKGKVPLQTGFVCPAPGDGITALQDVQENVVLMYAFSNSDDGSKLLVDFGNEFVDREGIKSLGPSCWVRDDVINAVVFLLNASAKQEKPWIRRCYLPTDYAAEILCGGYSAGKFYRCYKENNRYIEDLSKCEHLFVPMNYNKEHWFLCIINFLGATVEIWDPLPQSKWKEEQHKMCKTVVNFTAHFLASFESGPLRPLADYEIVRPSRIPFQQNEHDCGVFVMAYMYNHSSGPRWSKEALANSEHVRYTMAANLLLHGYNLSRKDLIARAFKWVAKNEVH